LILGAPEAGPASLDGLFPDMNQFRLDASLFSSSKREIQQDDVCPFFSGFR